MEKLRGQLIEFKSAKDRILGISSTNLEQPTSPDLSGALETFIFSRLPLRERIARTLATIFSRHGYALEDPDTKDILINDRFNFLDIADEVAIYAADNFTK